MKFIGKKNIRFNKVSDIYYVRLCQILKHKGSSIWSFIEARDYVWHVRNKSYFLKRMIFTSVTKT